MWASGPSVGHPHLERGEDLHRNLYFSYPDVSNLDFNDNVEGPVQRAQNRIKNVVARKSCHMGGMRKITFEPLKG